MSAESILQQPNHRSRPRRQALIGAGLLLLSACSATKSGNGIAAPKVVPNQAPPSSSSFETKFDRALERYGVDLNEKGIARIAMNTCVAWTNTSGGLTVTYNPGYLMFGGKSRQHADILVFGSGVLTQGYPKPSLRVSDGPGNYVDGQKRSNDIRTQVFKLFYTGLGDADVKHRVSMRHVSADLTVDSDGQDGYYHDQQTGQPVIRTELIEGQLDFATLKPVCNDLRNP